MKHAIRISEPATMATDFAIAAACVVFASGTSRVVGVPGSAAELWAVSFAFTAIAAAIGGVVHGFALHLRPATKLRLWKATQYSMGLTSLAMLAAAIVAFLNGAVQRWLLAAAVAKFVAYAAIVERRNDYSVVVIDYGGSMIGLAVLAVDAWTRGGGLAAPWLTAGVVVSGVAAAIQVSRISPHPRFNHNDLYHVIQIAALYLFYRGGLLLAHG